MKSPFKCIGLIGKYADPSLTPTLDTLAGFLRQRDFQVLLDETTSIDLTIPGVELASRATIGAQCDLAMVVGGDGTMLNVARSLADYDIPLVGINLGRLGFLADVSPEEMLTSLDEILEGAYSAEERFLLQTRISRDGERVEDSDAFNDAVIHKWNMARMIELETYIDDQFVEVQRADGLIVATPTGSTAYALSGGGPILLPALNAIVLVPICPHTLSNRPIVINGNQQLEVLVRQCAKDHAELTLDGQINFGLKEGDRIRIQKKPRTIRLLHPSGHDHFKLLRTKLRWGSRLD